MSKSLLDRIPKNRLQEYFIKESRPELYKENFLDSFLDDLNTARTKDAKLYQIAMHNNWIISENNILIIKEIKQIINDRIKDPVDAKQLCDIIEGAIIQYPEEKELYKYEENGWIDDENTEGNTYEEYLELNYVKK